MSRIARVTYIIRERAFASGDRFADCTIDFTAMRGLEDTFPTVVMRPRLTHQEANALAHAFMEIAAALEAESPQWHHKTIAIDPLAEGELTS